MQKMREFLLWVVARWRGNEVPIWFFWKGYIRPSLDARRYDIENDPYLHSLVLQKIEDGIKQFGSFAAFMKQYEIEIADKEIELEVKIPALIMRRMQREQFYKYVTPDQLLVGVTFGE